MTDDDVDDDPDTTDEYPVPPPDPEGNPTGEGLPDTDPRHLDPAADLVEAFERGEIDAELTEDADREDLREFVRRAEAGEFDAGPGLEAAVRIVRSLLEGTD